jgi:hypothetical protein
MTEQPEALRLADALDDLMDSVNCGFSDIDKAAAELRRLHERCQQLEEGLRTVGLALKEAIE